MKHSFIFLLMVLMALPAMAQIKFEQGYFIDNSGEKTTCLIRNLDWRGNPEKFQYKLAEEEEVISIGITQVQEFGIGDQFKFQRFKVMIDRSSDLTSELSSQRAPEFTDETLFLKVLTEGAATLYQYEGSNIRRFYFSMKENGSDVKTFDF